MKRRHVTAFDVCLFPRRHHTPSATTHLFRTARNGLSLLEVLISVAIFLGALTAIMQLLNTGRQSEVSARLKTEAVLRCEAKMGEIISGIEKAVSSAEGTFSDDEIGNWHWSTEVTSGKRHKFASDHGHGGTFTRWEECECCIHLDALHA